MEGYKLVSIKNESWHKWFDNRFNKKELDEQIMNAVKEGYSRIIIHKFDKFSDEQRKFDDRMMESDKTIEKLKEWFPDFNIEIKESVTKLLGGLTIVDKHLEINFSLWV